MTIQNYLTVNWDVSPRIITVVSGITEITIQDLHDTCRAIEARQESMDNDRLIDSAGKEFLGGNTYVGLTATLNNAVLAFAARPGPQWVLCKIAGGNLVSIDENGNNIDPRYPTAYITVDRASSSSATFLEELSIQHSSFGGGVTIDVTSSYAGTDYPIGTSRAPVNNLPDAKTIAASRGFSELFIVGNITLGAADSLNGYRLCGQGMDRTTVTVVAGCSLVSTGFKDCEMTGVLDGNHVHIDNSEIDTLSGFSGHIINSIFKEATVTLAGSEACHFMDCKSGVPGTGTCTIDMAGSGRELGVRNWSGGLKLINKTGNDNVSVDLNSGHLKLDSTVVSGTIVVRGVGHCTDNSAGATIVSTGLVSPDNITETLLETGIAPYTTSGTVGEAVSDTVTNARLIPGTL